MLFPGLVLALIPRDSFGEVWPPLIGHVGYVICDAASMFDYQQRRSYFWLGSVFRELSSAAVSMSSLRVWVLVLVRFCCFSVHAVNDTTVTSGNAAPGTTAHSSTAANGTEAGPKKSGPGGLNVDSSMIQRALYVLIGITMIGVLYFLIRAVR